jgi:hypothetical protein
MLALATVAGLLALFSLIGIVLSDEDPRGPSVDPWDNPLLWRALARR